MSTHGMCSAPGSSSTELAKARCRETTEKRDTLMFGMGLPEILMFALYGAIGYGVYRVVKKRRAKP